MREGHSERWTPSRFCLLFTERVGRGNEDRNQRHRAGSGVFLRSMANSSYVTVEGDLSIAVVEAKLKEFVKDSFQDRMVVERRPDWEANNPSVYAAMWLIYFPGSAVDDEPTALRRSLAPKEPMGFSVFLESNVQRLEFRHPFNCWEHWAQCVISYKLSHFLRGEVTSDADDKVKKPPFYDIFGSSFREYLSRNLKKPLSKDDLEFVESFKDYAPEGFW